MLMDRDGGRGEKGPPGSCSPPSGHVAGDCGGTGAGWAHYASVTGDSGGFLPEPTVLPGAGRVALGIRKPSG